MLKFKKSIVLFACLLLTATYSNAQSLKEAAEQQKRQQQQAIEQRAKAAKQAEQARIEQEAAEKRAEQARIKREERKRLGIPDVTKADLDKNSVSFEKNSIILKPTSFGGEYKINEILLLDFYGYYNLYSITFGYSEKYDSELKRKVFEASEEYSEKLEYLKNLRQKVLQTVFCMESKYEWGKQNALGKYDLEKRAFTFSAEPRYFGNDIDGGCFVFDNNKTYTLKVDEQTAVKLEDNPKVNVYIYFMFNENFIKQKQGYTSKTGHYFNSYLHHITKMRVIVAHSETGEIYFDESDPEDCLPLAKQERMTPEEYLAEHEKLKAEEKRRKEEQILQARRAEQERIDTDNNQVYAQVETTAEFPGGVQALNKFLAENLQYPKIAAEQGIQGRVVLRFIIETDGSISNVAVQRGLSPVCDQEAIRVVKSMPKWIPGKQLGKPVRVYYTCPIIFKLQQ